MQKKLCIMNHMKWSIVSYAKFAHMQRCNFKDIRVGVVFEESGLMTNFENWLLMCAGERICA